MAIERELKSQGFSEELLKREAAKVWALQKRGIIREIFFKKESEEAVIIMECENREEADSHLSSLPLVKEQLIEFSISEIIPYYGYERLFTSD